MDTDNPTQAALAAEPPAEALTTDTPAQGEQFIPKSRFDDVNKKLRELEKAHAQAAKDLAERERKQAEEQGEFKKLYEKAQADLVAAQAAAKQAQVAQWRSEAARKFNLPPVLASRLQGETSEGIEADARQLLEALPKLSSAATDAGAGINAKAPTPAKSDEEIKEQAARLGVSFQHLKAYYQKGVI
jgi:hypothetical protein